MIKTLKDKQSTSAIIPDTGLGPSRVPSITSNISLQLPASGRSTITRGLAAARSKIVDQSGPLGLTVVHAPDNGHKVDIVFVHGLGGTSRFTWSKNQNPKLFWPRTFLPWEPDIHLARIMTFGYNASLQTTGNSTISIFDIAKQLLSDLKHAKDQWELEVGKVSLPWILEPFYSSIASDLEIGSSDICCSQYGWSYC